MTLRALFAPRSWSEAPGNGNPRQGILKQIYGYAILHGEKIANWPRDVGPASIATFTPKDRALTPTETVLCWQLEPWWRLCTTIRSGMKSYLLTMVRKSEIAGRRLGRDRFRECGLDDSGRAHEAISRTSTCADRPRHHDRVSKPAPKLKVSASVTLRRGRADVRGDFQPRHLRGRRTGQEGRSASWSRSLLHDLRRTGSTRAPRWALTATGSEKVPGARRRALIARVYITRPNTRSSVAT